MEKKRKHLQRSQDVSLLIRSTSEYAAFGSVLLALACGLYLEAAPPVPLLLFGLAGCFTLHAILLRYAQESPLVALSPPVAFVLLFWVSLYTGAASSPFIFLFILFILGGYLVKPLYGTLYLIATILGLLALYLAQSRGFWAADSSIPPQKEPLLAALVFGLFLVLVGGVFGKRLVQGLHNLYQSKESLERRAEEKEMLLKEVHHRVKNNLQTVSSLLRMQGRAIDDPHTLNQIRSSQNRVVCMAMVHEMLYMREDLSCIEYSTYVQQLADYLVKSVKGTETDIRLKIDVPEIELGIDTALPLGLLINEAVTNALKYGFAGRETGEISISLEKEDAHGYVLRIGDDGIGYPENMDYKASKSLGLKLIHNLSRQLRGSVIRDLSKRGTNYVIRFQEVQQDAFHSLA